MDTKGGVFGVGELLRVEISEWAQSENGTPHVYPDHPSLDDVSKSSYPRATVDIIGNELVVQSIEQNTIINDVLFEITVYAVTSSEMHKLLSDCIGKVYAKWEDYLPNEWSFNTFENITPTLSRYSEKGFTRHQKGVEFRAENVLQV